MENYFTNASTIKIKKVCLVFKI